MPDRKARIPLTPTILSNAATNPGVKWVPSGEVYWSNDVDWSVAVIGAKMGSVAGAIVGNADQPGLKIQVRTDRHVVVSFDKGWRLLRVLGKVAMHIGILGEKRQRRWGDEKKLDIVMSVGGNGVMVTGVAQRHDVTRQQIHTWHHELMGGGCC